MAVNVTEKFESASTVTDGHQRRPRGQEPRCWHSGDKRRCRSLQRPDVPPVGQHSLSSTNPGGLPTADEDAVTAQPVGFAL